MALLCSYNLQNIQVEFVQSSQSTVSKSISKAAILCIDSFCKATIMKMTFQTSDPSEPCGTRIDDINASTRSDGSCISSSCSSGSSGSRKSGDILGAGTSRLLSNINLFPINSPKKQNHHRRSRKHHNLPLNLDCLEEEHGLVGRDYEIHKLKDIWQQVQNITIECDEEDHDKEKREIDEIKLLQEQPKEVALITSLKQKKEIIVDKVWIRGESGCGKTTLIRRGLERIKNVNDDGAGSGSYQFFVSGKFEQPTMTSSSSRSTSPSDDQRRPLSAISDAITQLCDSLLENQHLKSTIEQLIRREMTDAELRILGYSLPSIGLIVNIPEASQDALPPVTSEFAFQRFCDIFRKLFNTICSSPSCNISICMFLDDMQWCDEESLQVIKTLATKNDRNTKRLLLIGATRDLDAPPAWWNSTATATTELSNTTQIIQLEPLSESNVNQLVSKLLDCRSEKTEDLSQLVYSKTNGNPYFVIQYMELLHQRNLVRFHFSTGQWEYDLETITSTTNVSDNVVDFLTTRLQEMPSSIQRTLRIAACLGFKFEVGVLDRVLSMLNVDLSVERESIDEGYQADDEEEEHQVTKTEASDAHEAILTVAMSILEEENDQGEEEPPVTTVHPEGKQVITLECARALKLAADYGLIEPSSFCCNHRSNLNVPLSFKFSHDRVQQSALALLPAGEEGIELRIQLGVILLELSRKSPTKDWMLFSAVDLLIDTGYGKDDSAKSREVVMACRDAAVKARVRSAFEAASKYADRGLALLNGTDPLCWQKSEDTYQLCLELCTILSQTSYSHGDYERSDMAARQVLANAKCLEDKLLAFSVRVAIFGSKGDLGSGVKEGLKVITLLGIDLPSKPTKLHIIMAVKKTERLIKGKRPADLRKLPTMADPRHINQMKFLHTNCVLAWHAGQAHLCILQCLIMMQNTMTQGLCQFSPPAFCLYGALMARFEKYVEAFEFAKLALELLKQPNFREEAPLTLKIMHLFLYHLRRPIQESLEPLLEGYHLGMEIGDIQMASRTLCLHGIMCVVAGMPVASLTKQIEEYCQFFRDYRQHDCLLEISPWLQFTRILVSSIETSSLVLSGSLAEEEELSLIGQNDPILREDLTIKVYNVTARIMLYCVFGDFSKSFEECKDIKVFDDINYSFFLKPFLIFFSGLTYLCLAKEKTKKKFLERGSLLRKGKYAMKELKKFLKGGSVNHVPMLRLLEAELYGALNEPQDKVLKTYQSAIATAGRSGFRLIKAMACERAGQYCLTRLGDKFFADDYFVRAAKDYADYGALAKFTHIEKKYTIEDLSTSFLTQDTTTSTVATATRKSSSFFIMEPTTKSTTTTTSELYISTSPF